MMKPVSSFHKGAVLLPGLAMLAGGLAACLPEPDEPIEYLQRPDSIVIQMKRVDLEQSELEQRLTMPDFTLYGDGTLIYREQGDSGSQRLLQTELPEEAVRDLLEFVVREGFLDFFYDQSAPREAAGASATYVYVNTKNGTNSVRALGLGAGSLEGATKDLERVEKIARRLTRFDPAAVGGGEAVEYVPEAIRLFSAPVALDEAGLLAEWPLTVDLSEIAGSGRTLVRFQGEPVEEVIALLAPGPPFSHTFQQDDSAFSVGYRPILPFEENFPEFDQP